MLGDISPQTVRITQQAVVYPGRDHVTSLRVEHFDGRTYKPVDMTAVNRVILSFPEADPAIVYDSSVQAVFTHVGATLTVDLSDYAMPASVLGCQIILYDAEHPAGQVLVDDIDAVVQFDFRNVSPVGGIPAPAVDYLTDAPIDGVTYARKDGVWVPVDALVSGVLSVNGQSGVVVLDTDDIAEGVSNLYFTNGRAAAAAPVQTVDGQTGAVSLSSSYAPLSHVGDGGAAHSNAVAAGTAGFMTGADKTKLDGIAVGATQNSADATLLARANHTGTQPASTISDFASAARAQTEAELVAGANITITPSGSGATRQLTVAATGGGGGGSTNLSTTTSTTTLTVNSDTGTDAVLPAATGSVAGVLTAADKTKLDGIATGATANANTDSLSEGPTNKYFAEPRVLATLMAGFTLIAGGAVSAADSLLVAVGKLQKQINDLFSGKQDTLVSGTNIKTVNGSTLLGAGDIALEKYRGLYVSLAALNAAVPTANAGDYADVDAGAGSNVKRYIWDSNDSAWVEQGAAGAGMANPMTTAGDLIYGGSAGVPARLPIGSTSQVMTVAGGVPTWADPSGAALTNFTEAKSVAAPNATIPAVSLTATSSEANVDLSLRPKGTGALLAAIPDNAATGGNKRGARAVDLQTGRSNAAKVASGDNSVIGGGLDNLASAVRSTVGGGNGNSASGGNDGVFCGNGNSTSGGQAVVAGGGGNSVAGPYGAIVGGGSNAIGSGSYCFIGGGGSNACAGAGDYRSHLGGLSNSAAAAYASTTGGRSNVADGLYSVSLGGYQASAKGVTGAVVHASGQFSAVGDAQAGSYTLRIATTNATPAVLTADASATPVAANSLTLGGQNAYVIRGRVIARNTANGECWAWEVTAIARRTNTAATTALVGSPTVTSLGGDASLSGASIAVTANTTLGSVAITVTGIAATGIRWMAVVDTVEVG